MPLNLPPKCWRGRDDCEPLHMIDAMPEGTSEEDFYSFNYTPVSFVCAGCVHADRRGDDLPQDAYRVCFKNHVVDEMSDNDEQDLTHLMAVISQALAVIATRRVNSGMIEVPTKQGK